jgi:ubiquinone/menaquinone biosynthesis C-methylase UbiE
MRAPKHLLLCGEKMQVNRWKREMMNMGLSEEEGAKYWDGEARSHCMEVEKHKERYRTMVKYIIDLTNPKKDDVVMEIGAGTGVVSLWLASKVKKVIAVDFSKEMLRIAKERAIETDVDNVEFVRGTFHNPGIAEKVDIIVTIDSLHCTRDGNYKKRAIEIMYDHLKDEGKVFLEDEMIVYDQEILKKRADQIVRYLVKLAKRSDKEFRDLLFEKRPNIHDLKKFFDESTNHYVKDMAKTEHLLRLEDLVGYFEESGFEVKETKRLSSLSGIIYAKKT